MFIQFHETLCTRSFPRSSYFIIYILCGFEEPVPDVNIQILLLVSAQTARRERFTFTILTITVSTFN